MKRRRRREADNATQPCPWCGEPFEVYVDLSAGSQRFIEDCQVCCRPIEVAIDTEDGEFTMTTERS